MALEFGVIDHIDRQKVPVHQTFDERIAQVERFDKDGFYAYHLTEHHFTPHGLAPSPIAFLSAVSRITKRIKLIPTVFVLPTYHPLRLAEEICMLDHLSHGRFEFGVGRGIVPHELSLFGINPHEAADITKDAYAVLMKALTQEKVSHRGDYYKFFNVPMELRPYQKGAPAFWVTSSSVESMRAAGRDGSNIMLIKNPADCNAMIDMYMESFRETHPATAIVPKIGLTRHIYISRSQSEAEERGWFGFKGWYGSHSAMWKRFDSSRGEGDISHYIRAQAMSFGTPEFVRDELLAQIRTAPRVNYLVPRFSFGDLTHDECMKSYDMFRTEVMPALQEMQAAA